ncbi:MAG: YraN family protein [Bacteroidetes bacterium]|nr:MAG: YraN family protein [Bacteroidota bacterium]
MAKHIETGRAGEAIAVRFLEQKNYEILETNWRFSKAEVDIIAKDLDVLVFVEVKTRTSDAFGRPDAFITPQKERLMADAAAAYMEKTAHEWEIRFDVISILMTSETDYQIQHFRDAFFPGLGS